MTTGHPRSWRQRIIDHDGDETYDGGIERWLRLTDILGFERYVISGAGMLPGTRFAVEAYLIRATQPLEADRLLADHDCSPDIITERVPGMLASYDFISSDALSYFDKRSPRRRATPISQSNK